MKEGIDKKASDEVVDGAALLGDRRPTVLGEKPRVVVTLTTLPGRIHQIRKVLESLLQQTLAADEIRVYPPTHSAREQRAYAPPPWLAAMAPRVPRTGLCCDPESRCCGNATRRSWHFPQRSQSSHAK